MLYTNIPKYVPLFIYGAFYFVLFFFIIFPVDVCNFIKTSMVLYLGYNVYYYNIIRIGVFFF